MQLANPISITPEQTASFRNRGALELRGLVHPEAVAALSQLLERELASGQERLGVDGDFDRLKYGVRSTEALLKQLIHSPQFKRVIHRLIPTRLLAMEVVGFELVPGKIGLDWHFDLISFSYVSPESDAYSLWIPLATVDPAGQRGGMEYVPTDVYSARDHAILTSRHFMTGPSVIEQVGGLAAYRALMPCTPAERVVLDAGRVESGFAAGDALLFSRYVWHRSCPMLDGPITKRLALVVRFVAADARYSSALCRKFGEFSVAYGNPNVKLDHGLQFDDLADGDPMVLSRHAADII